VRIAGIAEARLDHLDPEALSQARGRFALKHANRFSTETIKGWSDAVFLDRARLTIEGQVTAAALLLVGRIESSHLLSPHPAQMTWRLEGPERAYEHFGPPFLLASTALYQRIRNIQIRILPDGQLLPVELAKYDQAIVLEALHNCVAHQDYRRNGRIVVTERPDRLIFENEGAFFDGAPEDYLTGQRTPRRYRNPFLAQAMVALNLIDTLGYGIHRMMEGQRQRFFPLPDYDIGWPDTVRMTLPGAILDAAYSRLLIQKTELPLEDVVALDRVQKRLPLDDKTAARLKRAKLIEGRKPNFHVSAAVAETTQAKAAYIKTRSLDDVYYRKLLTDYLAKFEQATRADINDLLESKISDALNPKQKATKISYLLTRMRQDGLVINVGSKKVPIWRLIKNK